MRMALACVVSTGLWLSLSNTLGAQDVRGLTPQSRQEFQRVYGSGNSGAAPPTNVQAAPRKGLSAESANEFGRVQGATAPRSQTAPAPASPEGSILQSEKEVRTALPATNANKAIGFAAQLQRITTPFTIDSTLLNVLLETGDDLRFLILWHLIAIDVTAIDHRALLDQSPSTYHEQLGPARTARALALVHQAMFEAANAFEKKYLSTLSGPEIKTPADASRDAAIVEAAYQTLGWLYPGLTTQPAITSDRRSPERCLREKFSLVTYYDCSREDLIKKGTPQAYQGGLDVGREIAGRIIADRSNDGSERAEPVWNSTFAPRRTDAAAPDYPYTQWQIDPVSRLMTALGGEWGTVRPFALTSGFQFRPTEDRSPARYIQQNPDPKALPSYNAIATWGQDARLDGSGNAIPPGPGGDGFFIAQFWAYDGTINLCAPARLYNQIAATALRHIADRPSDGLDVSFKIDSVVDVARYYALINFAMSDAAVAAWDAKFYFQFPRPVTYIRAVQHAERPKNDNAPNPLKWFPIGAQNTNSDQPFNITPPFPAYPSGHAVFGGALFGTLRQFVKSSATFEFTSDEFNGKNKDVFNYIRCSNSPERDKITDEKFCKPRTFTLDCAERENADSRLFMGVHWVFDADDGIVMGNKVAREVFENKIPLSGAKKSPSLALYSVDETLVRSRNQLICPGINVPRNLDDPDVGFGRLNIERVAGRP